MLRDRERFREFIRGHIALYRQPIYYIGSEPPSLYGFEVLSRVHNSPEFRSIADLVRQAEKTHVIDVLDRYVFTRSIKKLSTSDETLPHSVNVSAMTIVRPHEFSVWLKDCCDFWGVAHSSIKIELTETAPLLDLNSAVSLACFWLKEGGRFAIDDAGAGYVSNRYLKMIPFTALKVDGSIIEEIDSDPFERLTLEYLQNVARLRGANLVAEKVERQATLNLLREMGVEYAQGYLLGKPSPWIKQGGVDSSD